jgi:hypothetical protein
MLGVKLHFGTIGNLSPIPVSISWPAPMLFFQCIASSMTVTTIFFSSLFLSTVFKKTPISIPVRECSLSCYQYWRLPNIRGIRSFS